MNTSELYSLQSGAEIIAIARGQACGFSFDIGTIGKIVTQNEDDELHRYIQFTSAVRLDFSYFAKEKWERLVSCGQCERSYPASAVSQCLRCERIDYCAQCLETHNCVIPKMGISRRPRPQSLINRLSAKGETHVVKDNFQVR